MEIEEFAEIQNAKSFVFLINRCNFHLNNVDVTTEISNPSVSFDFTYPVYNYGFTVTLTNMFINVQGVIFHNKRMSSNLLAENITVNAEKLSAGFLYDSECNYPEAQNFAECEFRNIIAYTTSEKMLDYGFIINRGNANFTLYNITSEVFGSINAFFPVIGHFTSVYCLPQDGAYQKFSVDRLISRLPNNKNGDKIGGLIINVPDNTAERTYHIIVSNTVFEERHNDYEIMFGGGCFWNCDVTITNVTVRNSSPTARSVFLGFIWNLTIDGFYTESNTFSGSIFQFFIMNNHTTINDMTFVNNTKLLVSSEWYVFDRVFGSLHINNVTVSDISAMVSPILKFVGYQQLLTVRNIRMK